MGSASRMGEKGGIGPRRIGRGQGGPSKGRSSALRAIQNCPWALVLEMRIDISMDDFRFLGKPNAAGSWISAIFEIMVLTVRWCALLGFGALSFGVEAQECPHGWEPVAREFLEAQLDGRWADAARQVVEAEQQAWLEWHAWDGKRQANRLAAMPEALQEREADNQRREANRLGVSVYTCETVDALAGRYRIRVDPDGRSFKVLNLALESTGWGVVTRNVPLGAEQRRTATAYFRAVDAREWEKAEAWVAKSAIPRFKGYQLEVETFFKGSPVMESGFTAQAELRAAEWAEGFVRAEEVEDGIRVVHMEFPSATSLSCEMTAVDGTWRVLHR